MKTVETAEMMDDAFEALADIVRDEGDLDTAFEVFIKLIKCQKEVASDWADDPAESGEIAAKYDVLIDEIGGVRKRAKAKGL